MTNNPTRPEVDDPRVVALAKARQRMAHRNPFNVVCPPWEGLSEQEQHLSLLDARNYLRAAVDAGLVSAVVSPPATDRAGLLAELIAMAEEWDGHITVQELRRMADEAPTLPSVHTLDVQGFCPACGHGVLMLGEGGHVTCTLIDCPNPSAADELLRGVAGEAQQPDTETQPEPPTTCWHLEILDGVWGSYGPIYNDRDEALARYRSDNEQRPTWNDPDRTPVQRRVVRETTTYTVEIEHTPEQPS